MDKVLNRFMGKRAKHLRRSTDRKKGFKKLFTKFGEAGKEDLAKFCRKKRKKQGAIVRRMRKLRLFLEKAVDKARRRADADQHSVKKIEKMIKKLNKELGIKKDNAAASSQKYDSTQSDLTELTKNLDMYEEVYEFGEDGLEFASIPMAQVPYELQTESKEVIETLGFDTIINLIDACQGQALNLNKDFQRPAGHENDREDFDANRDNHRDLPSLQKYYADLIQVPWDDGVDRDAKHFAGVGLLDSSEPDSDDDSDDDSDSDSDPDNEQPPKKKAKIDHDAEEGTKMPAK